MGKAQQRKGADGERELARILAGYGYDLLRGGFLSFGTVPDLVGLPGIHIEVKRCEQVRLANWIAQARLDAQKFEDGAPTVFHRRSRSPWLVTMELEDWMGLYSKNIQHLPEKGGVNL